MVAQGTRLLNVSEILAPAINGPSMRRVSPRDSRFDPSSQLARVDHSPPMTPSPPARSVAPPRGHCRADTALRDRRRTTPAGQNHSHGGAALEESPPPPARTEDGQLTIFNGLLFFFGRSFFPPKKLLSMLLMSRPTTCSTKFVLGRSPRSPT